MLGTAIKTEVDDNVYDITGCSEPRDDGAKQPAVEPVASLELADYQGEWLAMESFVLDEDLQADTVKAQDPAVKVEEGSELQPPNSKEPKLKQFQCPTCFRWFAYRESVERHRLGMHSKEDAFKCQKCGRILSNAHALEVHMAVHSDERPYKCDDCDYSSKYMKDLTQHRRKHTGELLKCQHCEFTTHSTSNLGQHRSRLHKQDKPFKCSQCPKLFAAAYLVKKHERKHGKAKCTQCEYKALTPAGLRWHVQRCHPSTSQE